MKKYILFACVALALIVTTSCERVAPNYYGVLMENYGKTGKSDYTEVQGRVNTTSPGTELFQVPAWEQRANFGDKVLHLKAADNTEFSSRPTYSYRVIKGRATDVVFNNSQLGNSSDFMVQIEDNILEPKIYDIMKEASRKYITDTLMSNGGSLKFEQRVQDIVAKDLLEKGFELIVFSSQLEFSAKVTEKIDQRNEVNSNVTVIDQQIIEQKKRNELELLKTEQKLIQSRGITDALLKEKFLDVWAITKQPLYGGTPFFMTQTK